MGNGPWLGPSFKFWPTCVIGFDTPALAQQVDLFFRNQTFKEEHYMVTLATGCQKAFRCFGKSTKVFSS